MIRRHGLRALACILSVCGALLASPAAAQDRLFVTGSDSVVEIGAFGRFGQPLARGGDLAWPLVGGGRFAVRAADVLDLSGGRRVPLPAGGRPVAFDRARPRVFVGLPTLLGELVIAAVDAVTGEVRPLASIGACPGTFGSQAAVAFAGDVEMLFVSRCSPFQDPDVLAIDVGAAGPITHPVAVVVPPGAMLETSPDGARLFVAEPGVFGSGGSVSAFSAASGALLATVTSPGLRSVAWDDTFGWLVVTALPRVFDGRVEVFDANLSPLGGASFPDAGPCGVRVQTSPHTERIYVTTGGSDYYGAPPVAVTAFAGQPLAPQATARLDSSVIRSCLPVVVRTAPGPPRNLRASVGGRDVTLNWQNVGGASGFVLDIGFGPGRTAAQVYLGPDSRASFANVPPGTYYLRLRGGNEFGGGRPSQEIRVVVP